MQSEVWDYSSMEERRSETPTMLASGKLYIPAPDAVWGGDYSSMEERRSETPTMLASGKFCIPASGAVWGGDYSSMEERRSETPTMLASGNYHKKQKIWNPEKIAVSIIKFEQCG